MVASCYGPCSQPWRICLSQTNISTQRAPPCLIVRKAAVHVMQSLSCIVVQTLQQASPRKQAALAPNRSSKPASSWPRASLGTPKPMGRDLRRPWDLLGEPPMQPREQLEPAKPASLRNILSPGIGSPVCTGAVHFFGQQIEPAVMPTMSVHWKRRMQCREAGSWWVLWVQQSKSIPSDLM